MGEYLVALGRCHYLSIVSFYFHRESWNLSKDVQIPFQVSVTGSTVSVKGGIFIDENTIFISENTAYLSITHNPFITRADLISVPVHLSLAIVYCASVSPSEFSNLHQCNKKRYITVQRSKR